MPRRTERALLDEHTSQFAYYTKLEDVKANVVYLENKVKTLQKKQHVPISTWNRVLFELKSARYEYDLTVEEYHHYMYEGIFR